MTGRAVRVGVSPTRPEHRTARWQDFSESARLEVVGPDPEQEGGAASAEPAFSLQVSRSCRAEHPPAWPARSAESAPFLGTGSSGAGWGMIPHTPRLKWESRMRFSSLFSMAYEDRIRARPRLPAAAPGRWGRSRLPEAGSSTVS